MRAMIRPAFSLLIVMSLLLGVVYPLVITGLALLLFARPASGSLIAIGEGQVASELIGQPFTGDRYFWPRPSATGPFPYNSLAGSGSNFGPSSPALIEQVTARVVTLRAAHPARADDPVPMALVTASASGLDPHISPEAAEFQVERVAAARGMNVSDVRALVEANIEPRTFGVLGEPRVNVLRLNLALDGRERAAPDTASGAGSCWPMSTY